MCIVRIRLRKNIILEGRGIVLGVNLTVKKPLFSSDQIVNISQVQRKWRKVVEPKLEQLPFLMMYSGSEPKATILSHEKFEKLWQRLDQSAELQLKLELAYRLIEREMSEEPLLSLKNLVSQTDITLEDLEEAPDVEIDAE